MYLNLLAGIDLLIKSFNETKGSKFELLNFCVETIKDFIYSMCKLLYYMHTIK